ncbi:GAF domain-containing protein [Nocardioides cavernae]|uniref:GAF domain-containing protein n=1 Tax=Nocardioides cavernae TaxID=1921566 RepID=A0A7Y9H6J4_9ACTN|nr:GAF and ANTAR domain-containing protein [Nocardioides cavernae]NYE38611.1 GAF domain-containing protein [Nocardioides cavernae]
MAAQLRPASGAQPTAQSVIDTAVGLIPDARWASVTIRSGRRSFETLTSTHDEARAADRLQYELGEGPCVDAATEVGWLRTGDVGHDPRWPTWGPQASRLGVSSLLSLQLTSDDQPVGALNLYSPEPDLFRDDDEIAFALLYASHAALALTSTRQIEGLRSAISSRHVIGLAQGILMERYDLTVDTSFALLRRYSNVHNAKLARVAADVVSTRRLPSGAGADGGGPTPGTADPG